MFYNDGDLRHEYLSSDNPPNTRTLCYQLYILLSGSSVQQPIFISGETAEPNFTGKTKSVFTTLYLLINRMTNLEIESALFLHKRSETSGINIVSCSVGNKTFSLFENLNGEYKLGKLPTLS